MPNIFSGFVTKTGVMRKTITVTVHRKFEHPKLLKTMHRTTKILVHDEQETARIGDSVTILHGRAFSKRKHYNLQSIDRRAHVVGQADAPAVEAVETATATPAQQ
ncbi:uncharacterized protein EHS24_002830 [Apiotrichum porosum]|uniref:30S ribosomal protein S17 n=1 Tax=Apiotrichum porosum TaxID=105984 RepID=A0A427XFS6_9TREE|nr:uncharacterized protein EHS24_002830 [Apiotrichum porosum]RSH77771.1 hypothetical protein EHS24_002830 [Apiotrichum porosum]